jgi:histidinol-phosphate/aromatic aminotransferase/cobyric acid decarboxylase-like protein
VAFDTPAACYHGGKFFAAVGDEFQTLERLDSVINADVLDAWFPPSPKAIAAIERHLPQILRTSPPTGCEGLMRTIARVRGVRPECILPGAGSSDLIFLALRHWLTPASRVLILDPTYGEYAHILERVVGCRVERLPLQRAEQYRLDPGRLELSLAGEYDLVVLVNPNSPTGQHVPREELEDALCKAPMATRIWVDETYIEYAGPGQSLEPFAARSENVIVCKSMSKVYALSGARAAYLCAGPHQLESLRPLTPPWAVSLPAQIAAVKALEDPGYYAAKYEETHALRRQLVEALKPLKWKIIPGVTNFVLCHLPENGPDADTLVARCRERGLFLRNVDTMGTCFGNRAVRLAVKDAETNRRMAKIVFESLGIRA